VGEEWVRVRGGGRARLLALTLVLAVLPELTLVLEVLAAATVMSPEGPSMLKAANACSASTVAVEQVELPLLAGAPVVTEASDCPSSGGMSDDGRMMMMLTGRGETRTMTTAKHPPPRQPTGPTQCQRRGCLACVVLQQSGIRVERA